MAVSEKIIETYCPQCSHMCRAPVTAIGKKIVCGSCGHLFETVKFTHASLFRQFCTIAVKNFLITESQLNAIISEQKLLKQQGHDLSYEEMFVFKDLTTSEQKNRLLAASVRKLNKMFVDLAVEKKIITAQEGEAALEQQAMDFKDNRITLVGDILAARGHLNLSRRRELLYALEQGRCSKEREKQQVIRNCSGKYPFIGVVAVEKDILTKAQLDGALKTMPEEQSDTPSLSFAEVLYRSGLISNDDKNRLVLKTLKRIDKELGKLAMARKLVGKEELIAAASHQADLFKQYRYIPLMDLLVTGKAVDDHGLDALYAGFEAVPRLEIMALVRKGQNILAQLGKLRGRSLDQEKRAASQEATVGEGRLGDLPSGTLVMTTEYDGEAAPVEPEITLSITDDFQSAYIILSSELIDLTQKSSADIVKDVKKIVADHHICFGIIDDDLIDKCIQAAIFKDRRFRVASGVPPTLGQPGRIQYHFEVDYLKAGVLTEEGIMDFRDRGDVPFVRKDDVLATLIPPVQGTSGVDIYGNPIDVKPFDLLALQQGAGTRLSEDKLILYADTDGRPERLMDGRIAVYSEITIKGDVNFETGHIDFKGNINIQGTISQGFRVRGVNVVAQNITGGTVEATGNVDVAGGVVDGAIRADGHVQSMYMTGTTVDAYGDLLVVKEIIDSDVRLGGMCKSDRCKIISSSLSAKMGVFVNQIGTDVSAPCHIRAGVDDYLETLIHSFKEQISVLTMETETSQSALEHYHDNLRNDHQKLVDIAMYQEKLSNEIKKLQVKVEQINLSGHKKKMTRREKELEHAQGELKKTVFTSKATLALQDRDLDAILAGRKKIESSIREIESLNETIRLLVQKRDEKQGVVKVSVKNQIFAKTAVSGKHASLILEEDFKNVTITEVRKVDPKGNGVRWEMTINKTI